MLVTEANYKYRLLVFFVVSFVRVDSPFRRSTNGFVSRYSCYL